MSSRIKITWKRSAIGQREDHKATIKALGFRRVGQTIEQVDSPDIRGMVHKVRHLVVVEEEKA